MSEKSTKPTTATSNAIDGLADAVSALTEQSKGIRTEVGVISDHNTQNAKLLRILTGLMIAKLVTLVLLTGLFVGLFFLFQSLQETSDIIRDCTTPQGECAKRGAASTGVFLQSSASRAELKRIETELPAAEAAGNNPARVQVLKDRRAQLEAEVIEADRQLADIRTGKLRP